MYFRILFRHKLMLHILQLDENDLNFPGTKSLFLKDFIS